MNKFDFSKISLDDKETFKLLGRGRTVGVFQLESKLGQEWSKKLKPESIDEIAVLTTLLRPGALSTGVTEEYCKRKFGKSELKYLHHSLEPVLKNTRGLLCVHENTMVTLENGNIKKISSLTKQDRVLSVNLKNKKIRPNKIQHVTKTKNDYGLEITLSNNSSVIVTKDHKVLTYRGFVEAQNLNENDVIACPKKIPSSNIKTESIAKWLGSDENIAYLFGQLTGDGCLTSSSITIASGKNENTKRLKKWIEKNLHNTRVNKYFYCRSYYLNIINKELLNNKKYGHKKTKIHNLLEKNNLKTHCKKKRVPKIIFDCSDSVKLSYLAGLFDADGHHSKNGTHFCSSSKNLLLDVSNILKIFGVSHGILNTKLNIYNTKLFSELIEKYLVIKKIDGKLYNGDKHGYLPQHVLRDHWKKSNLSMRQWSKKYKISRESLRDIRNHFGGLISKKLKIDNGDLIYHKIKKINKTKKKLDFYDIGVERDHNFIGNNIIVHNCFQEQIIDICNKIAGYSEVESDTMRKSIGKKDAKLMSSLKKSFIKGCIEESNVPENIANELFENIRASQMYLFNRSHSYEYGMLTYYTAYAKTHYPNEFFCSYLIHSKNKPKPQEEIEGLIQDCRHHEITVTPPRLDEANADFIISKPGFIRFGLSHVKNIGESSLKELSNNTEASESWCNFVLWGSSIGKRNWDALIKSGACDYFGISRKRMMEEMSFIYGDKDRKHISDAYKPLTKKELPAFMETWGTCCDPVKSLESIIERNVCTKARIPVIEEKIQKAKRAINLKDSNAQNAAWEKIYLGINLTCSAADDFKDKDTHKKLSNIIDNPMISEQTICFVVDKLSKRKTKKGDEYLSVDISDNSAQEKWIKVWPRDYNKVKNEIYEGAVCEAEIKVNVWNGKRQFTLSKIKVF